MEGEHGQPLGAHSPAAAHGHPTESGWPPILAVLSAAGLYATLPTSFVAGSSAGVFGAVRWIVPALALVLLVPFALSIPRLRLRELVDLKTDALKLERRLASLAVIALISAANVASIVLLVHLLLTGAHAHARDLLRAAIHMWCMNVLVFGLWFWQLDSGGPTQRRLATRRQPDFLFPQQTAPQIVGPTWQPSFIDYLYVSFTNATAFSPTDTMPLSQWAKLLMLVQAAGSLLLAVMVAARAVNILQ
jgi:hypothetical protein